MALRLIVCVILGGNLRQIIVCFAVFYTMKCINSFSFLLLAMATPLITPKTTSFISKANYSPPSSGNHRSLFVKPAKRGKQRAGGEALSASPHFTFNVERQRVLWLVVLQTLCHHPTLPLSFAALHYWFPP